MPSVYFLRNCNNYEEHNDFLIEEICSYGALCFNSHHHELCIFTSNEQEFACFHCKKSAPAEVTRCFWQCCCNAPPTTSLCSHPLFDLHKLSTGISKCQWVSFFFHMEEFNSMPLVHLCFHVRCHFVRVPLCCHLSHSNKM